MEQLEANELYNLAPESRLALLVGLVHRLMSSYSVQDYMEARQREATELWCVSFYLCSAHLYAPCEHDN